MRSSLRLLRTVVLVGGLAALPGSAQTQEPGRTAERAADAVQDTVNDRDRDDFNLGWLGLLGLAGLWGLRRHRHDRTDETVRNRTTDRI